MLYQAVRNGLPASEAVGQLVVPLGLSATVLGRAPSSHPQPLLDGPGSRRSGRPSLP